MTELPHDESSFRSALDADGLLRPGAMNVPQRSAGLLVFAQRSQVVFDIGELKAHAARFFDVKLGLTVDKRYGAAPPDHDAARVVVRAADPARSGTRLSFGRRADPDDWEAADLAERRQNTSGMGLLARRCGTVWLVVREPSVVATDGEDRVALMLAAILASSFLGPILASSGDELFGVRTARAKLDATRPDR